MTETKREVFYFRREFWPGDLQVFGIAMPLLGTAFALLASMRFVPFIPLLLVVLKTASGFAAGEALPPFDEVARQALHYARLAPGSIHLWEKRVRKAPLLPRLQMGFERRLKNFVNVGVQDSVSVTTGGVAVGPPKQEQVQNSDNNYNFEIKAVWFLDQLLFSRDDLEISQEARELARERERILQQARQSYFRHRRGLKELALLQKTGAPGTVLELKSLELAESASVLDGLTGGWFGAHQGVLP